MCVCGMCMCMYVCVRICVPMCIMSLCICVTKPKSVLDCGSKRVGFLIGKLGVVKLLLFCLVLVYQCSGSCSDASCCCCFVFGFQNCPSKTLGGDEKTKLVERSVKVAALFLQLQLQWTFLLHSNAINCFILLFAMGASWKLNSLRLARQQSARRSLDN